jgi:2,5-dioxopentanoate dehydrogenase
MVLTGHLLIGFSDVDATAGAIKAFDPIANREIEPLFALGGEVEVDSAIRLADRAFDSYNASSLTDRADFLDRIADKLDQAKSKLARRASLETGLPSPQLEGETTRAAAQFRKFAIVVRKGRFRQVAVDPAQLDRKPMPRMDYRLQKIGIGPVAIFGASNFPISYSVAGGDTASALAAGCTVVLKAHNAHPGASEIMGRVIRDAVRESGFHEGVFSLVRGSGNQIGEALVLHPLIKAVSFTGSEGGGLALHRLAQKRPDPIPVFAEMSSVNPTFVLPAALAARAHDIGKGFAERMLFTVGQACLKPAIILAIDAPHFETMRQALVAQVAAAPARTMLTPAIYQAYRRNLERQEKFGARRIAQGASEKGTWDGRAALYEVDGAQLLAEPKLADEVFGPSALLVRLRDIDQMLSVAESFRGQLSTSMQLEGSDFETARKMLPILERRTGRVIINAFSIPQEVSDASIHGGPFPATTDGRFTSVGMTAIDRFLRPVCYQGFPDELLPESLKDENPLDVWRLVDGEPERA